MRILVIAEGAGRGALLVALAASNGHGAVATAPEQLLAAVAAMRAEVLLIDAVEDPERGRRILERARAAVDVAVPAVLVLADGSAWLHGALPIDMQPAVVLANVELGATLDAALHRARGAPIHVVSAGAAVRQLGALGWLAESREVVGPAGRAVLTASEAKIMEVLAGRPGLVIPTTTVSRALWGEVILDRHGRAAIRSHVHTLRRKLRTTGLEGSLVSLPGLGYRLAIVDGGEGGARFEAVGGP